MSDDGLWVPSTTRAVEVEDDHRLGGQVLVADAGRLDRDQAGLGVAGADVAAGPDDQVVAGQLGVQPDELLADGLEHAHVPPIGRRRTFAARSPLSTRITSFSPRPK